MNGKSGMLLALAVVCGLGAMYGVRRLLTKDRGPVEMRDVLVCARDIQTEEILKEDMVRTTQVPASTVQAGAFSTFKELEGRWVRIAMLADEPVVEGKLAPKNAPKGLVGQIPKGMRAVAIEVNEKTGVSGFILPEHRVDVVQAKDTNTGQNRPSVAETILEDVLILAAGTVTARPDDKSIQVRTVTLALTPEQVDTVVAAGARGPLSLSLRGLNDHEPAKKKAANAPVVETSPVLFAARDLKADEPVRPEWLTVKELPRGEVPAKCLSAPSEVTGLRPRMPIFAGEPILKAKLAAATEPTGPRPRQGMRAVALQVDDTTGVAGAVQTGHFVDVIWTNSRGPSQAPAAAAPAGAPAAPPTAGESRLVLQDVRVLEAPYQSPQVKEKSGTSWTITLEVHARDLAELALARASGTLTFALRDEGDHSRYTPPRVVDAVYADRMGTIYRGVDGNEKFAVDRRLMAPAGREPERFEPAPATDPEHAPRVTRGPS